MPLQQGFVFLDGWPLLGGNQKKRRVQSGQDICHVSKGMGYFWLTPSMATWGIQHEGCPPVIFFRVKIKFGCQGQIQTILGTQWKQTVRRCRIWVHLLHPNTAGHCDVPLRLDCSTCVKVAASRRGSLVVDILLSKVLQTPWDSWQLAQKRPAQFPADSGGQGGFAGRASELLLWGAAPFLESPKILAAGLSRGPLFGWFWPFLRSNLKEKMCMLLQQNAFLSDFC